MRILNTLGIILESKYALKLKEYCKFIATELNKRQKYNDSFIAFLLGSLKEDISSF